MMTQAPLERETQVFNAHLGEWRETHLGEYVLIKADKVLGFYESLSLAFEEGTKLFGLEEFFVKQILPGDTVNVSLLGRHLRSVAHT